MLFLKNTKFFQIAYEIAYPEELSEMFEPSIGIKISALSYISNLFCPYFRNKINSCAPEIFLLVRVEFYIKNFRFLSLIFNNYSCRSERLFNNIKDDKKW